MSSFAGKHPSFYPIDACSFSVFLFFNEKEMKFLTLPHKKKKRRGTET